jgi:predicted peptidase
MRIILTFFILLCYSCNNQLLIPDYEKFVSGDKKLAYRILYPQKFDKSKKYPIKLFLHGIRERGNDNESQLTYVDKVFLNKKNFKDYPSIVVFPQAPLTDNWSSVIRDGNTLSFPENDPPTNSLNLVIKLMDSLTNESYADRKRIYLSGLSNGGMGSFELLKHRPNMFASAVIICGGGNPTWAKEFAKSTPVWIAHGSNDQVVKPDFSLKMVEAIINEGGSPKVTFFENVYHNSWDYVFSDAEYLKWMYSLSKN